MTTTVHNLRCEAMRPGDVRVDRKSRWGNPFVMGKDGTREEVVALYVRWLRDLLAREDDHGIADTLKALSELHGKRLFCWCAPQACHGDVLARAAAWAATAWPAKQAEWEAERIAAEADAAAMDEALSAFFKETGRD